MLVVSSKLWINTLQRRILVGLWLLDTVSVSLLGLVVSGMVLRLSHFLERMNARGGCGCSIVSKGARVGERNRVLAANLKCVFAWV